MVPLSDSVPEIRAVRLARTFAVELTGLQLSSEVAPTGVDEIRSQWLDAGVAVLRNQQLGDEALTSFSRRFGTLFVHVRSQFHSIESPEVLMVSNVDVPGRDYGTLGKGELGWHTDQAYTRQPAFGTLLYAIKIPDEGGHTEFSDLMAAFDEMPNDLRRRVLGRRITYSIDASLDTQGIAATEEQRRSAPVVSHPIVRLHPMLRRPALYVSPDHAVGVEGMDRAEGDQLLSELHEWATQPRFRYSHRWRVGDVVMWDNARVIHRRTTFPPGQHRVLKRTGFMLPEALGTPLDGSSVADVGAAGGPEAPHP